MNSKDEFKEFLTKLKELLSELSAFVEIKRDISSNLAETSALQKKQSEINGTISKYSSASRAIKGCSIAVRIELS